ncbi:uncharacterized protein BYT42DRAFT_566093 [Radiomyces spectabilis]|uniref:uncharacterized protein n=1 Tax=Radiomyces spectabilis TaxID=64574 RepID=UPI002220D476|nr:uncharacterized protein BYT42DRAFT_566093 [Radiomyces spectabilis]KAI8381313.1 hypothetical protein BYT42DRAFT_566093 [Radiomyces spectabilis]
MRSKNTHNAWLAAQLLENLWLRSHIARTHTRRCKGALKQPAHAIHNAPSHKSPARSLPNVTATDRHNGSCRWQDNGMVLRTVDTLPVKPSRPSCSALRRQYSTQSKNTSTVARETTSEVTHPSNESLLSGTKNYDEILSAALQQSDASTAHFLIDITLQLLRSKNPVLAWECYTDLRSRDMFQYISRDKFKQLISQFNKASTPREALEYVLTVTEDMKSMGYALGRKEKLLLMRLLGSNGKMQEMEKIHHDLLQEEFLLPEADIQKAYNIMLQEYQAQMKTFDKRVVAEKSMDIYGEMLDRGIRPGAAATRLFIENIRRGDSSFEMVDTVWEWFWNKLGMHVGKKSHDLDPVIYKEMLLFFASAGRPEYMLEVNDLIVRKNIKRDVRTMTALIHKVGRSGDIEKATAILDEMKAEGLMPNIVTFNALIDIHVHKRPEPDLAGATRMYDMLHEVGLQPDVRTFGTLIDMFAKKGDIHTVRRLYQDMISNHDLKPNPHIYSSMIECFLKVGDRQSAIDILRIVRNKKSYGLRSVEAISNLLIRSYIRDNNLKNATGLLLNLLLDAKLPPSPITFTPLLAYHADLADVQAVEDIVQKMRQLGVKPNVYTYTTILEAYAKAGDIEKAESIFDEMQKRWQSSVRTYNTLLYVYVKQNEMTKVLDTYQTMVKRFVKHNEFTYGLLISFFSRRKEPMAVESLLNTMDTNHVKPGVIPWTLLMQTYFNCNRPAEARQVLERMTQAGVEPNYVTLSVLIDGCVRSDSLALAEEILENTLSDVSLQDKEARRRFPGRQRLADASVSNLKEYIDQLPTTIEDVLNQDHPSNPIIDRPPPHLFTPLLNAYRLRGDVQSVKTMVKRMLQLSVPLNAVVCTTLMNFYKDQEQFHVVDRLWKAFRERDVSHVDLEDDIGSVPVSLGNRVDFELWTLDPDFLWSFDAGTAVAPSQFALSIYMDALTLQDRHDEVEKLWSELTSEGYAFDEHNWNRYIVTLLDKGQVLEACKVAKEVFLVTSDTSPQLKRSVRSRDDLDDAGQRLYSQTCQRFAQAFDVPELYDQYPARLCTLIPDFIHRYLQTHSSSPLDPLDPSEKSTNC